MAAFYMDYCCIRTLVVASLAESSLFESIAITNHHATMITKPVDSQSFGKIVI